MLLAIPKARVGTGCSLLGFVTTQVLNPHWTMLFLTMVALAFLDYISSIVSEGTYISAHCTGVDSIPVISLKHGTAAPRCGSHLV